MYVCAVILFCLTVALCSFGIVHATKASHKLEGERARDTAISAADGIAKQLSSASRAALSMVGVRGCKGYNPYKGFKDMGGRLQFPSSAYAGALKNPSFPSAHMLQAAVVKMNPNWSFLESNFEVLAKELFRQVRTGLPTYSKILILVNTYTVVCSPMMKAT
eukprot:1150316-Pelagomonas_calceolata.AAC.2